MRGCDGEYGYLLDSHMEDLTGPCSHETGEPILYQTIARAKDGCKGLPMDSDSIAKRLDPRQLYTGKAYPGVTSV